MNTTPPNINLVLASEEEEFFYSNNNEIVPEGEPIGVDWDRGETVELILFDGIYFKQIKHDVDFI